MGLASLAILVTIFGFSVAVFFGLLSKKSGSLIFLLLFGVFCLGVLRVVGKFYLIELPALLFLSWALLFGLSVDRRYNYYAGVFFIFLSPILVLMHLQPLAEISATLSYVLIVFGVIKDLILDRLYED